MSLLFLHCLGSIDHFFDGALHVERLLRNIVMLAFDDLFKGANSVSYFYVLTRSSGKHFGDVEGLGKETLHLASAAYRQLVLFREFIDTKNGDNILQFAKALQNTLHTLSHFVVLIPNNA